MNAKKTVKRKNKPRGGKQIAKSLLAPHAAEKTQRNRVEECINEQMNTLREFGIETESPADTRAKIRSILERDIKKPQ